MYIRGPVVFKRQNAGGASITNCQEGDDFVACTSMLALPVLLSFDTW